MWPRHWWDYLVYFLCPNSQHRLVQVHTYLESSTWIFAYVNQKSLQWKLDRYIETGYCDDLTLAMFFAVFSIALHYTPWTAPVLRAFPEPAMVCDAS